MASAQSRLLGVLLVSGFMSVGLVACSSDGSSTGTPGSEGTGGTGSGGVAPGSGGTGGAGTGGVSGTGGTTSSGGAATGGTTASTGGQAGSTSSGPGTGGTTSSGGKATGGAAGAGTGGSAGGASGGSTAQGGNTGVAGRTGMGGSTGGPGGGAGGAGTGGRTGGQGGAAGSTGMGGGGGSTTPGECVKGGFKGSELVIFGESFYDWQPPYIKQRIEENARKAGSLGANDSYRQVAKAGQNMAYIANQEYTAAVNGGAFKAVVMDGGGIDCMSSSCPTCPDTFKGLLDKFVTQKVTQVIYTRYPEPGNPPGSDANLKKNLDALMPKMETVCKGYTGLKCYWVDLRPVWVNGDTTDGLHPTKSGGEHVGDAIWAEMVKQCMAQ